MQSTFGIPQFGMQPQAFGGGPIASGGFYGQAGGMFGGDRGGLAVPELSGITGFPAGQSAPASTTPWSGAGTQASWGGGAPATPAPTQAMQPPPALFPNAAQNPMGGSPLGGGVMGHAGLDQNGFNWQGTQAPGMGAQPPGTPATFGSNPYQQGMADDITQRTQRLLTSNLNGLRRNNVLAGTTGSDSYRRLQGQAIGDAATGLSGSLSNLFGGIYDADQNRGVQRRGQDFGLWSNERSQDRADLALGAGLMQQGLTTPWINPTNANGILSNYSGYGQTSNNGSQGGGWLGGLGGALGGVNIWSQLMRGGNGVA